MIHFAYPNIKEANNFIGCGRYIVSDDIPSEEYDLADPDSPNMTEIRTVTENMVPDIVSSNLQIYEKRDKPDQNYRGESLDLAYLLAYINTAWPLKKNEFTERNFDIWCTGAIDIKEMQNPWLKAMDNQQFELKLEAFLSENNTDRLFIVPNANISNQKKKMQNQGVDVLSLNEISKKNRKNNNKIVLAIGPNDVPSLVEYLFEKPDNSILTNNTGIKNRVKIAIATIITLLIATGTFVILQSRLLNKQPNLPVESNFIEGKNDVESVLTSEQINERKNENQDSKIPRSNTQNMFSTDSHPRIAILFFENNSPENKELVQLVKQLPDMIFTDFVTTGKYNVVERENIRKIFQEINFVRKEYFNQSTAVRIGKMVGAQYVVFGSIMEVFGKFRLDVRMISVERGIAEAAEGITGKSEDFEFLRRGLVERIVSQHLGKIDSPVK